MHKRRLRARVLLWYVPVAGLIISRPGLLRPLTNCAQFQRRVELDDDDDFDI